MKTPLFSALAGALLLSTVAWAEPPAQYTAQDVINAYKQSSPKPAPAQPGPTSACPPNTAPGDDGVCEPLVQSRGFSLAAPRSSSSAPSLVGRSEPARVRTAGLRARRTVRGEPARLERAAYTHPTVTPGDLLITFKLGSAELTPQGRANARAFAAALNDPALASSRFEIAGYTDTSGSAERNKVLSEQRAEAVKAFLVSQGVTASRLDAKGYGSEQLADPAHPTSPANRRVEGRRLD